MLRWRSGSENELFECFRKLASTACTPPACGVPVARASLTQVSPMASKNVALLTPGPAPVPRAEPPSAGRDPASGIWANAREDGSGRRERFSARLQWLWVNNARQRAHQSLPRPGGPRHVRHTCRPRAPSPRLSRASAGSTEAARRRHCFFLPPRAFSSGFALARVTWARGERPLPRSSPPLPADKRVQMSRAARVSAPPHLRRGEINILPGSSLSPRAPSIKSRLSQGPGRGRRKPARAAAGRGGAPPGVQRCFGGKGLDLQRVGRPEGPGQGLGD